MRDGARVANAADRGQVRRASRSERDLRERDLNDLRSVLSISEGRRVLWRVLSHCSVFESVFHPSNSQQSHNSGRQDVGHWLMSEIGEAGQSSLFQMMQEAKEAAEKAALENRAARTPSATNVETNDDPD